VPAGVYLLRQRDLRPGRGGGRRLLDRDGVLDAGIAEVPRVRRIAVAAQAEDASRVQPQEQVTNQLAIARHDIVREPLVDAM
jgi:hypothetical protein